MAEELFLIDSNSLITPYRTYYSFDFAPKFWEQIGDYIEQGSIVLLDKVREELLKGDDELSDWLLGLDVRQLVDHREKDILVKYGEILQYIQDDPQYKPSALEEWSRDSVADAWLIATAAVKNYTIITFEIRNVGLNTTNPSKNAKIPDVADVFNVPSKDLYSMMRALGIAL